MFLFFVFFFKQKTAYEMRISDWSSDVCSSDLLQRAVDHAHENAGLAVVWRDDALAELDQPAVRRREGEGDVPGDIAGGVAGDEGDLRAPGDEGGEGLGVVAHRPQVDGPVARGDGAEKVGCVPRRKARTGA